MDWNVRVDVESACYVLQRSSPVLVPLAVTVETALRRAYLPVLRQLPEDIINFLHDPLACAIALGWSDGVTIREVLRLPPIGNSHIGTPLQYRRRQDRWRRFSIVNRS